MSSFLPYNHVFIMQSTPSSSAILFLSYYCNRSMTKYFNQRITQHTAGLSSQRINPNLEVLIKRTKCASYEWLQSNVKKVLHKLCCYRIKHIVACQFLFNGFLFSCQAYSSTSDLIMSVTGEVGYNQMTVNKYASNSGPSIFNV